MCCLLTNHTVTRRPTACNLENNIHIWLANIEEYIDNNVLFNNHLSAAELERSKQYKFKKDQDRFAAARNILRDLLAKYLDRPPKNIEIAYNNYGKPYIDHEIKFNISHSYEIALFAFTKTGPIGVDIEKIQPIENIDDIATQYFSTKEVIDLLSINPNERIIAFFNCWTRKEALIKALGTGLSVPLNEFTVTLLPNEPAKISILPNIHFQENWSVHSINDLENYAAALAVQGKYDNIWIHNYI